MILLIFGQIKNRNDYILVAMGSAYLSEHHCPRARAKGTEQLGGSACTLALVPGRGMQCSATPGGEPGQRRDQCCSSEAGAQMSMSLAPIASQLQRWVSVI